MIPFHRPPSPLTPPAPEEKTFEINRCTRRLDAESCPAWVSGATGDEPGVESSDGNKIYTGVNLNAFREFKY
jgi:hypothetical protein